MNYPRLQPDEYKNRKISLEKRKELQAIRKETGLSYEKLGKLFGLGETQARRICNPEVEKHDSEESIKRTRERLKTDDEFRKRFYANSVKRQTRYKKERPLFQKWLSYASYISVKKNWEHHLAVQRIWARNNWRKYKKVKPI